MTPFGCAETQVGSLGIDLQGFEPRYRCGFTYVVLVDSLIYYKALSWLLFKSETFTSPQKNPEWFSVENFIFLSLRPPSP